MPVEFSTYDESEKPTHHCGIGIIYSFKPGYLYPDLRKIGYALQHRGQNGAGVADDSGFRVTGEGLLKDAIHVSDSSLEQQNYWAMIHLRYSTNGGYGLDNVQPVEVEIAGQKVHVAVNGNIPNAGRLRQYSIDEISDQASDTVLATHTLGSIDAETMDERVLKFARLQEIENSANNMIIGVGDIVYIIRDQFGLRPLVVGDYNNNQGLVIASETVALQKIGSRVLGEFPPGAIVRISPNGSFVLQGGAPIDNHQICMFEKAYFSGPNSRFPTREGMIPSDWLSVMQFRMTTGEIAAREHPVPHADYVVGLPDSGVPFTTGYAKQSEKPYYQSITRSHYNGEEEITRTFMQDKNMGGIAALVRGKLMPVDDPRLWKDKVIVIGDDSLVRGNTAREVTRMLRQLGVGEIHWRYGFPPVQWPCHLGVSFRTRDELLAAQMDNDWGKIARYIGADSVAFISNEGLIQAARECSIQELIHPVDKHDIFAANGFCGGCVTGVYPVSSEGTIYRYIKSENSAIHLQ